MLRNSGMHGRILQRALTAALALAIVGCANLGSFRNPFNRTVKKEPIPPATTTTTQAAPGQTPAPGTSVVAASFEEQSKESQYAPQGVSLGPEKIEKSTWEKTVEYLTPDNYPKNFRRLIGKGPNEAVAKQLFAEGSELFRQKRYDEAQKKFREAAIRWPDSTLEEDALYMRAEALFFADRYYTASDTFASMLKKFENSRHLDKAMVRQFAIAQYWEQKSADVWSLAPNFTDETRPWFDPSGNAVHVYESIRMSDPTGPLADDALMATATSYFLKDRFEDADYHFSLLRKEYPRSEHQVQAHLLGLKSKLRSYQGAEYDEAPLVEADELVSSTLRMFGNTMGEERERLVQSKNSIRVQRAERDWESGEYYHRRRYFRAARFYYENIVNEYPETRFAEMAAQRLDETKDKPPAPKDYFAWVPKVLGQRPQN